MSSSPQRLAGREQVRRLSQLIEQAGVAPRRSAAAFVTTGCPPLDRLLPEHGFRRGALVEWMSDGPGAGAGVLAVAAARAACREGGAVAAIDRGRVWYPPAAAARGLDLASTLLIHPASEHDEYWALDQALRCEHVAAVLAWPRRLDGHAFRRLQLAAETSGAIGLLVRPRAAEREPSWAEVRILASPRPSAGGWRINLRLLRYRGCLDGAMQEVDIEINETTGEFHEAHPGHLAAPLAHPAARQQQA